MGEMIQLKGKKKISQVKAERLEGKVKKKEKYRKGREHKDVGIFFFNQIVQVLQAPHG